MNVSASQGGGVAISNCLVRPLCSPIPGRPAPAGGADESAAAHDAPARRQTPPPFDGRGRDGSGSDNG